MARDAAGVPQRVAIGPLALTTEGLGLMPGTGLALIQASESADDSALVSGWFDAQWQALAQAADGKPALVVALRELSAVRSPGSIYVLILHHLFSGGAEALDEDRVVNAATGIRETVVWNKLFRFQRDGVVGALDKP